MELLSSERHGHIVQPCRVGVGKLQPERQVQPLFFINKVLLEHSYIHLVMDCLQLLLYYPSRIEEPLDEGESWLEMQH